MDDRLTYEEFKSAIPTMKKWGLKIDDPREQFDIIDVNGGGYLLFDEFSHYAIKFSLDLEDDVDDDYEGDKEKNDDDDDDNNEEGGEDEDFLEDDLDGYDKHAYEDVTNNNKQIQSIIKKLNIPYSTSFDTKKNVDKLTHNNILRQMRRLQNMVIYTDYDVAITTKDRVYILVKNETTFFEYKNGMEETYFLSVSMSFKQFLTNISSIPENVPSIIKTIYGVMRRSIIIHSNNITNHIKSFNNTHKSSVSKINNKIKTLQDVINNYKPLLQKLSREEKLSKTQLQKLSNNKHKNTYIYMNKLQEMENKIETIRLKKKDISQTMNNIRTEIDYIRLISDEIYHNNVLLSHCFLRNQERLKSLLESL